MAVVTNQDKIAIIDRVHLKIIQKGARPFNANNNLIVYLNYCPKTSLLVSVDQRGTVKVYFLGKKGLKLVRLFKFFCEPNLLHPVTMIKGRYLMVWSTRHDSYVLVNFITGKLVKILEELDGNYISVEAIEDRNTLIFVDSKLTISEFSYKLH